MRLGVAGNEELRQSPIDTCDILEMYWVRLKGFYMVARFSANFSENCSEADSGRP